MTDDDLKKWRDLAEKATPGPWRVSDGRYDSGDVVQVNPSSAIGGRVVGSSSGPGDSGGCGPDDAAFIAAARQAIPALLDEVERLRARVLVPLTEQQVVAALHEGRAKAMAATGDNAWSTLLKQRDALRADNDQLLMALKQARGSIDRPPGCRCDLWPRGYCRQGCPSENAEYKAVCARLAIAEQVLSAYRQLYFFTEVWAAENELQRTEGERKLAEAILDCRMKLRAIAVNKTEGVTP